MPIFKERRYTRDAPKTLVIDDKRYSYHKVVLTKGGATKEVKKLREQGYWARTLKWGPGIGFWAVYKRKR